MKKYYCIDCKIEISKGSKQGRCNSCATKLRWSVPMEAKKMIKVGNQNGRYIDGRTIEQHYCKTCNAEINYYTWKDGLGMCRSCSHLGDKNVMWNNGSSFELYSLGWTKTFKEQIRYRDDYKCQICGKSEIEQGYKLHVHHIDYDKKNLKEINLISLCNSCHSKTNFNRDYWKKYFNNLNKEKNYVQS